MTKTAGHERLILPAILVAAAAVRTVVAALLPDQSALLSDATAFRISAAEIMAQGAYTSDTQMPLYPLLIVLTGPGMGQLAADVILSVASVGLVYALSMELFGDRLTAALAGLAAALYPPLVFFAAVGLSETLFITLVLAAFVAWYRQKFAAAAVFAVLAILTRPVFDAIAPLLVLIFAVVVHRFSTARVAVQVAVYAIVYCTLMAPWWVYNYGQHKNFVRLTLGSGVALYAGNNPMNKTGGGNKFEDYDTAAFDHIKDPVARDRAMRAAAVSYILSNPGRFIALAGQKFARMWRPWPSNAGYANWKAILASAASFVPVALLSVLGLFFARGHLRRLVPVLTFAAVYTAIHMVIVGTIRYRLPLEPFMLILAAFAVGHMLRMANLAPAWAPQGGR